MAEYAPICYQTQQNCFACKDGHCLLLRSTNVMTSSGIRKIKATRKNVPCPFYKTAEEAGGTYEELCAIYEVER